MIEIGCQSPYRSQFSASELETTPKSCFSPKKATIFSLHEAFHRSTVYDTEYSFMENLFDVVGDGFNRCMCINRSYGHTFRDMVSGVNFSA